MRIELTRSPSDEDAATIRQGLIDSNYESADDLEPMDSHISFSIFARDDDGTIVGGLRATCFWNTLHVELIWVAKGARKTGMGTALLEKAEHYAIENGFELALVESTDWQARPFYEKAGYQLVATIPQYPKGHACHFLTKRLVP